ncbi:hypothetical protein BJX96DRAFT_81126 [Aspergillus floccosus]
MWRFMSAKDPQSTSTSQPESKPKNVRTDSEISSLDLGPSVDNTRREATSLVPPEVKITPPPKPDQEVAGTHRYDESPVEDNDENSTADRAEQEAETPRQRGGRVAAVFRTISTPLLSPLRNSTASSNVRPSVYRARTSFRKGREE